MNIDASSKRSHAARLGALSWPIGIDLALLFTTFVIDSYFLSRLGDLPAGAIGALFPLFGLLAMILRQVAQAGAVVSAQLEGEGRPEAVALARRTTLWNGVGVGLGTGTIFLPLRPTFTHCSDLPMKPRRMPRSIWRSWLLALPSYR